MNLIKAYRHRSEFSVNGQIAKFWGFCAQEMMLHLLNSLTPFSLVFTSSVAFSPSLPPSLPCFSLYICTWSWELNPGSRACSEDAELYPQHFHWSLKAAIDTVDTTECGVPVKGGLEKKAAGPRLSYFTECYELIILSCCWPLKQGNYILHLKSGYRAFSPSPILLSTFLVFCFAMESYYVTQAGLELIILLS